VFRADQWVTDGPMAAREGKIVKKPKSYLAELLTDANAFEVDFPPHATSQQKATLVGASVFFNSLFFEETPAQEKDRIDSTVGLGAPSSGACLTCPTVDLCSSAAAFQACP
jgi:hypothetical protein